MFEKHHIIDSNDEVMNDTGWYLPPASRVYQFSTAREGRGAYCTQRVEAMRPPTISLVEGLPSV